MRPPHLAVLAAVSVGFAGALPSAAFAERFSFKEQPGEHLDVLREGKLLGRYMIAHDTSRPERREATYKPYLHVFDAGGTMPITKGAGGSFTHHRGIFVGWNKLNVAGKGYDRWHMKGGEQVHRKFLEQTASEGSATFTSLVEWMGADLQPILVEERTHRFAPAPKPAYALIDMTSKLKAVAGEVKLEGDPEHAGLQFRPAAEVRPKDTVYFFPGENADPRKERDYAWVGQSFSIGDKRFSVVYLNHPTNPKGAQFSAYRDYGRFGAIFRDTIPAGGEQTIRVRFLLAEGEMPQPELIQKAYNDFAGASDPVPRITRRPVSGGKSATDAKQPTREQAKP